MRFAARGSAGRGNGKARGGLLYGWGSSDLNAVETPALLLTTRKGLPSFVTPDLLQSLPFPDSLLLHTSPLHFIEGPPTRTVSSLGGLRQMIGLPESFFVAVPRDGIESLPTIEGTNKIGASFETPCGRLLVRPEKYLEIISSMRPNLWASLADEVPAWIIGKRNKASVDRTVRWLDECIALDQSGGEGILGAIVGGSSLEERSRCAKEVAERNVSGYWLGGFGLGESMEERPALLDAVVENLRGEKLRYVSGLGLPEEILQGVAAGIDLFDSSYIYHLTLGGLALVFPLDISDKARSNLIKNPADDGTKINLRATIYRRDNSPLVEGCVCFTCRNHTRAYIHHLLNVHEMLSQTLLEIHNTHHYLGFFGSIRRAIECGKFEIFRQKFIESRRELFLSAPVF